MRISGWTITCKTTICLGDVLAPYPADAMEAYEVSSLVNSVANNGPGTGRYESTRRGQFGTLVACPSE